MQAGNDDHEPLKPHTDTDDDRNDEKPEFAFSEALEPEKLDRNAVTKDQQPIGPPIWPLPDPVLDHEHFVLSSAVPAEERFHRVAVNYDKSCRHHHFTHINKVGMSDEVLHVVQVAKRYAEDQHHRKSGENRTSHEVRRKDRGMPTRNLRHREV